MIRRGASLIGVLVAVVSCRGQAPSPAPSATVSRTPPELDAAMSSASASVRPLPDLGRAFPPPPRIHPDASWRAVLRPLVAHVLHGDDPSAIIELIGTSTPGTDPNEVAVTSKVAWIISAHVDVGHTTAGRAYARYVFLDFGAVGLVELLDVAGLRSDDDHVEAFEQDLVALLYEVGADEGELSGEALLRSGTPPFAEIQAESLELRWQPNAAFEARPPDADPAPKPTPKAGKRGGRR